MMKLIHEHKPEFVINFGSCGNLKNHKVGKVMKVGKVFNNIDVRPFMNMVVHQKHLIVK